MFRFRPACFSVRASNVAWRRRWPSTFQVARGQAPRQFSVGEQNSSEPRDTASHLSQGMKHDPVFLERLTRELSSAEVAEIRAFFVAQPSDSKVWEHRKVRTDSQFQKLLKHHKMEDPDEDTELSPGLPLGGMFSLRNKYTDISTKILHEKYGVADAEPGRTQGDAAGGSTSAADTSDTDDARLSGDALVDAYAAATAGKHGGTTRADTSRRPRLRRTVSDDHLNDLEQSDRVSFYYGSYTDEEQPRVDPQDRTLTDPYLSETLTAAQAEAEAAAAFEDEASGVPGAHYGGGYMSTATYSRVERTKSAAPAEAALLAEAAEKSREAEAAEKLAPTRGQLSRVALQGGIPFVVFGFIDNVVMICVGERIDWAFANTFGLSMLACAGLGNMVSDVIGQSCGGAIEAFADKLGLPDPQLTAAQKRTRIVKTVHVLSGTVGIGFGCLLGMVPLLWMP